MGLELFNTFILLLLVVSAIVALRLKDLITSAAIFGIYSLNNLHFISILQFDTKQCIYYFRY